MRMSHTAVAACLGTEGAVAGAVAPPQGPARPQPRLAGELTSEELSAVCQRLPRGKAPGDDGLPYEFYGRLCGLALSTVRHDLPSKIKNKK